MGGIFCISMVNAFFKDEVAVENHIAIGDINIGIREYEVKNNREVSYENPKMVFPGDTISKIPKIINYADDCWIRVHISYLNDKNEAEGFSEGSISGMSADWTLRGDYYYYTKKLVSNDSVEVFRGITIPEEWNEKHSSQNLSIVIKAEAIQAANFLPDFSAMSPWGNQEIEMCVHEENGISACVKEEMVLSVEFNGMAHKLLAVPNNFFHNIKRAMPGDEYHDEIVLSNTTDRDAELFFRTEIENQNEMQIELLQKITLRISDNRGVVYDGNLLSKELEEAVSLGNFKAGVKGKLKFHISIPKELKNIYALREADVKWIFSVYENDENMSDTMTSDSAMHKSDVKTGDDTPVIFWMVIVLLSTAIVLWSLVRKKGEQKHEE